MANLLAALFGDRLTPSQRRAKELAKADYRLLLGLVRARREQGLTQQEIADRVGVSQPTIASFERQDADPKLSTIRRYANAVGAIVTHTVEIDRGQYDSVADWSESTYRVEHVASYAAAAANRVSFSLAA